MQHDIRMTARLNEGNRIARELHHTLLQGFQGLMLRFQAAMKALPADAPARRMIEQAMDRGDQVLAEGRQRVHDLHEDAPAGGDLPRALQHFGELLTQDHPMLFSLSVIGVPRPFDPTLAKRPMTSGKRR